MIKDEAPRIDTGTDFESTERKLGRKQKIGIALSGIALTLIAAGVGCSIVSANKGETPKSETPVAASTKNSTSVETTAPASTESSETASQPEKIPSVEELQIPAEMQPEQIAKEMVNRLNELYTVGLKQAAFNEFETQFNSGNGKDPTEWSKDYTQPYLDNYFTALFGENYESNPDVADFCKKSADLTASNLNRYVRTDTASGEGAYGYEVFQYKLEYEKADEMGASIAPNMPDKIYAITVHETNNNLDTNLKNSTWNDPSRDGRAVITFRVVEAKNQAGKDVIRITKASIEPINK